MEISPDSPTPNEFPLPSLIATSVLGWMVSIYSVNAAMVSVLLTSPMRFKAGVHHASLRKFAATRLKCSSSAPFERPVVPRVTPRKRSTRAYTRQVSSPWPYPSFVGVAKWCHLAAATMPVNEWQVDWPRSSKRNLPATGSVRETARDQSRAERLQGNS